jgi:WD40 repeat protein
VWELETLKVLRTIDVGQLAKVNIERSVTGLSFSDDSAKLFVIGGDDKHTVSVFDITESPAQILEDSPGQVFMHFKSLCSHESLSDFLFVFN